MLPESEILAFEATHRLKAGILARIFLIFFRCAAVLAAQQRRDASAKTGFKANGWSLVRNRDSPSSRGVGGLPQESSLIEQRTRLTLCQGDTIYHGAISETKGRPGGTWQFGTPTKSGEELDRKVTVGVRGRGALKHNKVTCFRLHASLKTRPGARGTLQTDFFQLQFGVGAQQRCRLLFPL